MKKEHPFQFKQFSIAQDRCAMKVGTDGVLLGAWIQLGAETNILDIGTGTGLIALMLAQRQAKAQVIGIEIDETAAAQAAENAQASPFAERVRILPQSLQDFAKATTQKFDLIVSNPPFFSGGVLSENQERASVRHTIKLSHQDLLRSVQQLLHADGHFCVILPWIEGLRFQELASSYRLFTTQRCLVSPRPETPANRLLLQFSYQPALLKETSMSIYEEATGTQRGAAYAEMTEEFYL